MGREWIKSFGSFERYVDYFCFNPFVYTKYPERENDSENDSIEYIPYDIVKSDMVSGKKEPIEESNIIKDRTKKSIYD